MVVLLLVTFVLLAGCSQQSAIDGVAPKDDVAFAKNVFSLLAAKKFEEIEHLADPGIPKDSLRSALEQIASFFPSEQPKSIAIVGAHVSTFGEIVASEFSFEYSFSRIWLLSNIVLQRHGSKISVLGIHVTPMNQFLEDLHRFTFAGKSMLHFIFFFLAIAIPLFILYVFVLCVRTPIAKHRWIWRIVVSFGFMRLSLSWTTGGLSFHLIPISLFGIGSTSMGPYGPVIVGVSAPIGAIVFLVQRRSLKVSVGVSQSNPQALAGAKAETDDAEKEPSGKAWRDEMRCHGTVAVGSARFAWWRSGPVVARH